MEISSCSFEKKIKFDGVRDHALMFEENRNDS